MKRRRKTEIKRGIYAFPAQNGTMQVGCWQVGCLKQTTWMFFVIIYLVCLIGRVFLVYTLFRFFFSAPLYICHPLTKGLLTKQYCWFSRKPLVL